VGDETDYSRANHSRDEFRDRLRLIGNVRWRSSSSLGRAGAGCASKARGQGAGVQYRQRRKIDAAQHHATPVGCERSMNGLAQHVVHVAFPTSRQSLRAELFYLAWPCLTAGPARHVSRRRGATVAEQTAAGRKTKTEARARGSVPEMSVRVVGALLALAVAAVHIADQGGITAFNSPSWIGWGYRLIEIGGALTALTLVLPRPRWLGPAWLGWAAAVLLGAAPFAAYIASRTVGVPGDPGDVGNWGYWVGTVSLFIEAALVMLSVSMLIAAHQRGSAELASQ
jgi:hypothetical protein